jgi:NAD(P)-dependent dehydrogenase (short-subunit alcohol dehydrogenase family)
MSRGAILVTGGNSGIGLECVRRLARERRRVIIASRDRAASALAVQKVRAETGNSEVTEMGLDLGSLAAVRTFAQEVEALNVPLDTIVCNAGLQTSGAIVRTPDGFERTFAVNHLGHFLLVNLLLRRLAAHTPARIMIVASGVHDPKLRTGMPKPDVGHLEVLATSGGPKADAFDARVAYVNSKLCNLWFAYELIRRLAASGLTSKDRPISVNAYEPGLVPGSGLARDYHPALRWVWLRVLPAVARVATRLTPTINTADKAGEALARLAVDPSLERISGKYFPSHARWGEAPSSDASYDATRAAALWEASVRMTKLTPAESPLVRDNGAPA